MIDRERIIHYALDLVSAPPGELPARVENRWDDLLRGAFSLRIFHPIAAWLPDMWPAELPETTRRDLHNRLELNKARNAALSIQLVKLAKLFNNHEIACMFFKGAAGLVRNLYPSGWRFMSDIDIIVPEYQISEAFALLKSEKYHEISDAVIQAHHVQALAHPEFVSDVELHSDLYQRTPDSRSVVPEVLSDADRLEFHDVPITVPSITDHAWILMRTDPVSRPFLPRFCDMIEISLINSSGYEIEYERLMRRAHDDSMPGIISGMSYACSTYGGMEPFAPMNVERLRKWEMWSLELRRKFIQGGRWESPRSRFVAVSFLPSRGFAAKARFFLWLCRLVCYVDRFIPGTAEEPSATVKICRIMKLALTYFLTLTEYLTYRIQQKK